MKNKIYIVSWNGLSDAGGVERVTQYLVNAWSEQYKVIIIDYKKMEEFKIIRKILKKHFIIDAVVSSLYVQAIKRKEPESKIVIQGFNCPFVCADVAIAHGTMRGYKIALENDLKWHFNQLFEKIGMSKSKRVIAVSDSVKKELLKLYKISSDKIDVIVNSVDTEKFYPIKRDANMITTILYAGRLEFGKGLNEILELANIIENREKYKFIIATNDENNSSMFAKLKRTKILVGLKCDEMNLFYNSGDVFFFPSLYEGFGLVTIEALSAGIPVIGRNLGAIGDLYKRNVDGVDILSGNIEENLKKIEGLSNHYKDYEERLKLHKFMQDNFSIKTYNENIKEIWNIK